MVAKITNRIYIGLANWNAPSGDTMKKSPIRPINMPITFLALTFKSKKSEPIITAQIGVREFSIPVSELFSLVSAMQKRKAGKKLPISPESITLPKRFRGIC